MGASQGLRTVNTSTGAVAQAGTCVQTWAVNPRPVYFII